MNHSKIIFLDFDGVLNTEHHQRQLLYERKAWQDKYGTCFDPEAVKQLQTIVDMTHADIVIESSWKYLGLEAMQGHVERQTIARKSNRYNSVCYQ